MPHLEVDIALEDGEHVRGTVKREDGEDMPFVGWIGLLSLLQAAVTS